VHVGEADSSVTLVFLIELRFNGMKYLSSRKLYCIVWLTCAIYVVGLGFNSWHTDLL